MILCLSREKKVRRTFTNISFEFQRIISRGAKGTFGSAGMWQRVSEVLVNVQRWWFYCATVVVLKRWSFRVWRPRRRVTRVWWPESAKIEKFRLVTLKLQDCVIGSRQDTKDNTGNWTYVTLGVVRCYSIADCFVGSSIPPSHHHNYLPVFSVRIVHRRSEMNIHTGRPLRWDTDEQSRCLRSSRIPPACASRNRWCGRRCLSRMSCLSMSLLVRLPSWWWSSWLFVSSGEWLRSSMWLAVQLMFQCVAPLFFVLRTCSNKSLKWNLWIFSSLDSLHFPTCDKHDRWQQSCEWDPAKKQSTWHI